MRYWSYLAAKLAVTGGFLYAIRYGVIKLFPVPEPFSFPYRERSYVPYDPFAHDLGYTLVMMLFFLFAAGLLWAVVWDQRYRCRTCVRRLRMPILRGSWNHILLGRPQMEYICPFGHGTLVAEELQITGHQEPDWQPHEDIWKELYSLEASKK
jgi:hypothetical protein